MPKSPLLLLNFNTIAKEPLPCFSHIANMIPLTSKISMMSISMTRTGLASQNGGTPSMLKDCFNSNLPCVSGCPSPQKHYRNNLQLTPSVKRPFCISGEHLHLWLPCPLPASSSQGYMASSSASAEHVLDFLNNAYAPGTRDTYGTGLLVFHIFCDQKVPPVPENE